MAQKFGNGIDLQGQRAQNAADPSSSSDLATKAYVDNNLQGLAWKQPVRVASTANVTVSNPGTATFDTVTISANDRILLKNQTTAAENGIYVFNGSAVALTRAGDMDTAAECKSATVFVTEGSAGGDKAFTQTAEVATLGTTAQNWVQFGGAGSTYTAGSGLTESPANTFNVSTGTASATGLEVSGGNVRIATAAAGNGLTGGGGSALAVGNTDGSITVSADAVSLASQVAGAALALTSGILDVQTGTASATGLEVSSDALRIAAAAAGNGLQGGGGSALSVKLDTGSGLSNSASGLKVDTSVVARKFSQTYGNGSSTSITVNHNLGTKDVSVTLRLTADDSAFITDWVATDSNNVTLTFATAPASNAIRATVIG